MPNLKEDMVLISWAKNEKKNITQVISLHQGRTFLFSGDKTFISSNFGIMTGI
jgi:hypothetical protein